MAPGFGDGVGAGVACSELDGVVGGNVRGSTVWSEGWGRSGRSPVEAVAEVSDGSVPKAPSPEKDIGVEARPL